MFGGQRLFGPKTMALPWKLDPPRNMHSLAPSLTKSHAENFPSLDSYVMSVARDLGVHIEVALYYVCTGILFDIIEIMDKVRGFPKRDYMDDPTIVWRNGVPNYDVVNKSFIEGRTKIHEENSLENTVQNLVKSWEMELTHKIRVQDWQTVDRKLFTISANGGKRLSLQEYMEAGNYNAILNDCPYYDSSTETLESSTESFQNAFRSGFPWEVLEVYSGPPVVAFSWRHWGKFEGSYKDEPPTDETIELFGCSVARVNDELKIISVDIFLDANPMMKKLTGGKMCRFAK